MTRLNFFLIVFLVGIISLASGTGFQSDPLFITDNMNVDNKLIGLSNAFGQDTATLFSQTNPKLTLNSNAATPTYNPPLAKCKTTLQLQKVALILPNMWSQEILTRTS